MKRRYPALITIGSILLLTAVAVIVRLVMLSSQESQDIGIIGGADAPTAIFLTSTAGWKLLIIIAAGVLGAALIAKGIIGSRRK